MRGGNSHYTVPPYSLDAIEIDEFMHEVEGTALFHKLHPHLFVKVRLHTTPVFVTSYFTPSPVAYHGGASRGLLMKGDKARPHLRELDILY